MSGGGIEREREGAWEQGREGNFKGGSIYEAWTARGKEGREEVSGGGIEREREGAREGGKLQGR